MEHVGRSSSPNDGPTQRGNWPFMNHNAATLPNNLPPNVDDKPLARQKRKRTSPEDQAVLEAYYARDPKPDKAARVDLVQHVALGEKEVQIWFQNRRQSSRRKTRPLLPHEIAQYQLSNPHRGSEVPGPERASSSSNSDEADEEERPVDQQQSSRSDEEAVHQAAYASSQSQEQPSSIRPDRGQSIDVHRDSFQGKVDPLLQSHRIHSMQASSSFPKYLAATQKVSSQSAQHDNILRPSTSEARPEPPRRIRKTSSYVRLSLSAGGAAEIITKDASSPSPPRPLPSMYPIDGTKLGISVRSETTAQQSPIPSSSMPLQRAGSGRSRDSRSWEFWCDKDGRSELENKAEKDSSGSAADAIQLLRSASGRSILGSIPNKRNSVLHGQEASNKRLRRDYRGPLQRSSTTTGRLQGKTAPGKIPPSLKDTKSALSTHIPGNESDKENWSPGSATQFDEQSLGGDKPSVGLGSRRAKQTSGLTKSHLRREGTDPEADPELAAFMRNGDRSDGSSRSEDLDCVQGLLSLSQGNWR